MILRGYEKSAPFKSIGLPEPSVVLFDVLLKVFQLVFGLETAPASDFLFTRRIFLGAGLPGWFGQFADKS